MGEGGGGGGEEKPMSHIHLPDGILPVWLWVGGFIVAILIGFVLFHFIRKDSLAKRLPLLGMMAAAMVLGASVEIVPIAYHVNLTVISGILLGPSLIFLATFVVNIILALLTWGNHGHRTQHPHPLDRRDIRLSLFPALLEDLEAIDASFLYCHFSGSLAFYFFDDWSGGFRGIPL